MLVHFHRMLFARADDDSGAIGACLTLGTLFDIFDQPFLQTIRSFPDRSVGTRNCTEQEKSINVPTSSPTIGPTTQA